MDVWKGEEVAWHGEAWRHGGMEGGRHGGMGGMEAWKEGGRYGGATLTPQRRADLFHTTGSATCRPAA